MPARNPKKESRSLGMFSVGSVMWRACLWRLWSKYFLQITDHITLGEGNSFWKKLSEPLSASHVGDGKVGSRD